MKNKINKNLEKNEASLMDLYRNNALWIHIENYSERVRKLLDIIDVQKMEEK